MLAIIGGTGFGQLAGLEDAVWKDVATPFGTAHLEQGLLRGNPVLFIPRHGAPPRIPPHRINYRANIRALSDAGARAVISVNAVGSVDATLAVPSLVIPDQIIDYTAGRGHTFHDDDIHHIDFTYPFDAALRDRLVGEATTQRVPALRVGGVYGCTEGPRLETAAEIQKLARDGCHIVGMTAMPEAALAREVDLPYASLSVVVNAGAGLVGAIDLEGIEAAMSEGMDWVAAIIRELAGDYSEGAAE